jgi:hypothetical protein
MEKIKLTFANAEVREQWYAGRTPRNEYDSQASNERTAVVNKTRDQLHAIKVKN